MVRVVGSNPDHPSLRSATAVPPLNQLREKGMAMTIVEAAPGITGGVDTHLDTHVAAALDPLGRLIGSEPFAADAAGYKAIARLARGVR